MQAKTTRNLWPADDPSSGKRTPPPKNRPQTTDTIEAGESNPEQHGPAKINLARFLGRSINRPKPATVITSVAVICALGAFFISRIAVNGEVYPGVQSMNVAVGGLSESEARDRLQAGANNLLQTQVSLTYGDKTWMTTLADLGARFDVEAAVRDAMGYGRDDHVISGIFRPMGLGRGSVSLPMPLQFDQSALDKALSALAADAGIAPIDAGFTVDNGTPRISSERDGQTFDGMAVRSTIQRQLDQSQSPVVPLTTIARPAAIRATDLEANQTAIVDALSAPMVFVDGDRRWTLATTDLVKMVRFTAPENGKPVGIALSDSSLHALGEQLASEINKAPTLPTIAQSEKVARLVDPAPGKAVRVDDLAAAITKAFADGQHEISVPFDEVPAAISTDAFLQSVGVTDLLAEGTSNFTGSEPGRATNVKVASSLVNGVMIPPQGSFSFNYSIGEINATPGYVAAGASENGIAGTAVGGGVCQVTTTVYRAVLKAGLPITEWWPHAYRNVYYEEGNWSPGFDASVQQPDDDPFGGSDFIFQNPTDHWMLIRAQIDNETQLKIDIYGTPTGYRVEIDDPVVTDVVSADRLAPQESVDPSLPVESVDLIQPARDGMTTTVVRHVYDSSGALVSNDSFVSVYEPQGPSYRVSPDMAGSTKTGT